MSGSFMDQGNSARATPTAADDFERGLHRHEGQQAVRVSESETGFPGGAWGDHPASFRIQRWRRVRDFHASIRRSQGIDPQMAN